MATVKTGLSRKLLTKVLSVYFILTLAVTMGQIMTEYLSTKHHIEGELQTLKSTFSESLNRALWELNLEQAYAIAEGLMALPIVEGIQIRDENGNYIADLGLTVEQDIGSVEVGVLQDHSSGLFGYTFPLIFEFSGRTSNVGDVTLYSSFEIIFSRIEVGVFFLIGNAILKTTFLVVLFLSAFRKLLTEPLSELTQQMTEFNPADPQSSKLRAVIEDENELSFLQTSYNKLIDDLAVSQAKLRGTELQLKEANKKLDEQKMLLEKEVAKKTAYLSKIMLDLEQQKEELLVKQRQLRQENENRQYIEEELRKRNFELADSMRALEKTGVQLVEIERIASLNGLINSAARKVDEPLASGVSSSILLQDRLQQLNSKRSEPEQVAIAVDNMLDDLRESTDRIKEDLLAAKHITINANKLRQEQRGNTRREINLKNYLAQVAHSLAAKLSAGGHSMHLNCADDLIITCTPGAIAQMLYCMVNNSLQHGFEKNQHGHIKIEATAQQDYVLFTYKDNGCGLSAKAAKEHFLALNQGTALANDKGLGTHIIYNLVTYVLHGSIKAESVAGEGISYNIKFPMQI